MPYFLKISRTFLSGKQNVSKTSHMKLISENLANMSILPDKNLVVTFTQSFFFTEKDLIEADSWLLNSRNILVFLESTASAISNLCLEIFFFSFLFLGFAQKNLQHLNLPPSYFQGTLSLLDTSGHFYLKIII